VFDIGIGEILVLGLLGLLVFGPEKLPRAAADAARWLRQVRGMAASARQDLANSAGMDFGEAKEALKDIADLHPRRIAASIMGDDPEPEKRSAAAPNPAPNAAPNGAIAAAGPAAATGPAVVTPPPAPFDPDAP